MLGLSNQTVLGPLYDAAIEFGKRIASIVSVIAPGIAAIKSLGEYVHMRNIEASVRQFIADILEVAKQLMLALGNQGPLSALYDAAIEFGKQITAILSVIAPGMAALKSLSEYTHKAGIEAAIRTFIADVLIVAQVLQEALSNATADMLASYAAAATFGAAISAIFTAIAPALTLLKTLDSYGGNMMGASAFLEALGFIIIRMGQIYGYVSSSGFVAGALLFGEVIAAFTASLGAAMSVVASLSAYDSGFNLTASWMDGLIGGLNSRLGDLDTLLAYIRGLFPSSPAKYGPWKTLPEGAPVTTNWMGDMARGLGQTSSLERALGDVRGLMTLGGGFAAGRAGMAGAPSGGNMTLNLAMNGPFHIREEADLSRLAEQVGAYLGRQANTSRRLGQQR
jgi:hypothetical protein